VRDRDSLDPAQALDLRRGLLIEQRDAVPEEIALWRLDQQGPLPNGELRLRPDPDQARLMLLHHIMEPLCLHGC